MPQGVNGQAAVRHTGDELSGAYNDIIPQLRLQADDELRAGLGGISSAMREEGISEAGERTFNDLVERGVTGRLRRGRGRPITGNEYKAADEWLERTIDRFARSEANPDHQIIAGALRDMRAEMRNAIVRQNGQLGRDLDAIDEGWSMLIPAERAAAGAPRGFYSPRAYRQALARGDSRVRRRGMARGEVRGQDIADAGIDVLPPEYPNPSGTAGHEAYSLGNARFWQGLGARALYGPGTQNAIGRLTINRPPMFDPVAEAVARSLNYLPTSQAAGIGAPAAMHSLFGF